MVTHEAFLTHLFNAWFAGPANQILAMVGMKADNAAEPWADFMVMQILVFLLLILVFTLLRGKLSVDKPGALQHVFELIHGFITDEAEGQVGHDAHKHTLMFETLFIFLLAANLLGLVPGFVSPTQVIYVPVGCALLAFLYFNIEGIKKQGAGKYLAHLCGPVWWLAPLMIPIEVVGLLARPMSLSIRLFANMYAGEQVTMVFLTMTYFAVPAVFMGLHVFVSLLQAYIFTLLTMIYVAGAVEEAH